MLLPYWDPYLPPPLPRTTETSLFIYSALSSFSLAPKTTPELIIHTTPSESS